VGEVAGKEERSGGQLVGEGGVSAKSFHASFFGPSSAGKMHVHVLELSCTDSSVSVRTLTS